MEQENFKKFITEFSKAIDEEKKDSPILQLVKEKLELHMRRGKSYSAFIEGIKGFQVLEIDTVTRLAFNTIFPENYDKKYSWAIGGVVSGELWEFLELYFKKNEGFSCSVDKVRFVINRIQRAVELNECQNFESTYASVGMPDMDVEGKKPYWCPETLQNTDEVIDLFKDYQQVCKYLLPQKGILIQLADILKKHPEERKIDI